MLMSHLLLQAQLQVKHILSITSLLGAFFSPSFSFGTDLELI